MVHRGQSALGLWRNTGNGWRSGAPWPCAVHTDRATAARGPPVLPPRCTAVAMDEQRKAWIQQTMLSRWYERCWAEEFYQTVATHFEDEDLSPLKERLEVHRSLPLV